MTEDGQISLSAELVRKGIHLCALTIPIGYSLIPFLPSIICLSVAAAIAILLDIARFRKWRLWDLAAVILDPIIRDHEYKKGGFTGASYILTTSAVTIILFPKVIAITAIVFIIIGDTAAAIIGRLWGRHKIIGSKSLEGSLACLASLVLVSFLIPGIPTIAGIAGAVAATLAEAYSGKIDDNLTVPIISGLVMLAVMRWMGYENAVFFDALGSM